MTETSYGLSFVTQDGQGEMPGRRDFATLKDAESEIPAFLRQLLRVGTDDDAESIMDGKFIVVRYEKGELTDTDEIVLRKYAADVGGDDDAP